MTETISPSLAERDKHVALGMRDISMARQPDGSIIVTHPEPLAAYPERFTERLEHWAKVAPHRVFLGERDGDGWRTIDFAEALACVEAIAQALLERGLGPTKPVMILSINSIDHALVALACMHVGIPSAPVSLGYATLSTDFARLAHAVDRIAPAAVYTHDAALFADALTAVLPPEVEIIASKGTIAGREVSPLVSLKACRPASGMARARDSVNGSTVARLIFTSGSSSLPKAVINTNRMLASNQQMHAQIWRFLQDTPPVMADWAPWNHTAGANVALGAAIYFGGSLYIDDGRATDKEIRRTIENAADVRPTVFFGVPLVYQLIVPILKADPQLRDRFFDRLQMVFYAGGTIAEGLWKDLRDMMLEARGHHIFTCGGYGATEMSPSLFLTAWDVGIPGVVGHPVPGVEVKLVPIDGQYEVRVKGPSVTPGYWRNAEATAKAFDDEGYYRTGDAVRFISEDRPLEGFAYAGRLSENFKLNTGTWVSVAGVRAAAVAAFEPIIGDAVVAGQGHNEIGIVVFPILEAARSIAGCESAEDLEDLVGRPAFRREMQRRLDALAARGTSATTRVRRLLVIAERASGTEITDKNTLSFNAVLSRRSREIAALFDGAKGDPYFTAQSS